MMAMKVASSSVLTLSILIFTPAPVLCETLFHLVESFNGKQVHDASKSPVVNKVFFQCKRDSECTNVVQFRETLNFKTIHDQENFDYKKEDLVAIWEKLPKKVSNIALGKPANPSSIFLNASSGSYAVDGDKNTDDCSETGLEYKAWLRIDLKAKALVKYVNVISNQLAYRHMSFFDIRIGNIHQDGGRGNPACKAGVRIPDSSNSLRVTCPEHMVGQYVTLNLAGRGYAEVCELEVFGFFI